MTTKKTVDDYNSATSITVMVSYKNTDEIQGRSSVIYTASHISVNGIFYKPIDDTIPGSNTTNTNNTVRTGNDMESYTKYAYAVAAGYKGTYEEYLISHPNLNKTDGELLFDRVDLSVKIAALYTIAYTIYIEIENLVNMIKGTPKIENPLANIRYTDKVKTQATQQDYHGFPESVDGFGANGKVMQIIGGDNIVRTKVEIPGSYMGKEGIFQYIIESDGITCNHRIFVPNN